MVEGARLESVYAGNRIAGSNPAPSARLAFALVHNHSLLSLKQMLNQMIICVFCLYTFALIRHNPGMSL